MVVNKKAVNRTRGTAAKKAPVTKAAAKKAPAATPANTPASNNPFDKGTPSYYAAALLLKSGAHSWEELTEAAGGSLSTRTFGGVLRKLESAGFRFAKTRSAQYGTVYQLDKTGAAQPLANNDGPDATGNHKSPSKTASSKASTTGAAKKTAGVKKAGSKSAVGHRRGAPAKAVKPAAKKGGATKLAGPAKKSSSRVVRRIRGRAAKK